MSSKQKPEGPKPGDTFTGPGPRPAAIPLKLIDNKVDRNKGALVVYLPDTRGVTISPYGHGNLKIGPTSYTYSRLPGNGSRRETGRGPVNPGGTCPGSTDECEEICYAKRILGPVREMYARNSATDEVPPIPADATMLRLHVSGDFNSEKYVRQWIARLTERPDVTMWVYTRSWRIERLLPVLEELRKLPNVQMFASVDQSARELPPKGWRRAWIEGDPRAKGSEISEHNHLTADGVATLICPEEVGRQPHCEACGYCIDGKKNDVTFLRH